MRKWFSCKVCESKDDQIKYLRAQLDWANEQFRLLSSSSQGRLVDMAKDCQDRVMSRSYTEYALGKANEHPSTEAIHRTDEDEYAIEQRRKFKLENDLRALSG